MSGEHVECDVKKLRLPATKTATAAAVGQVDELPLFYGLSCGCSTLCFPLEIVVMPSV
jgi:hypothetical protein